MIEDIPRRLFSLAMLLGTNMRRNRRQTQTAGHAENIRHLSEKNQAISFEIKPSYVTR